MDMSPTGDITYNQLFRAQTLMQAWLIHGRRPDFHSKKVPLYTPSHFRRNFIFSCNSCRKSYNGLSRLFLRQNGVLYEKIQTHPPDLCLDRHRRSGGALCHHPDSGLFRQPHGSGAVSRFLRGYRGFPGAALRHADHLPDPETRRYRRRPGQEKKMKSLSGPFIFSYFRR